MQPIEFSKQNTVLAKNQPQYLPLPAMVTRDGRVVTCWKLTWRERWKVLIHGLAWLEMLTFGQPLQPVRLSVNCPATDESEQESDTRPPAID